MFPHLFGTEIMIIETILFVAFIVVAGVAIVKLYEWRQDVSTDRTSDGAIETKASVEDNQATAFLFRGIICALA